MRTVAALGGLGILIYLFSKGQGKGKGNGGTIKPPPYTSHIRVDSNGVSIDGARMTLDDAIAVIRESPESTTYRVRVTGGSKASDGDAIILALETRQGPWILEGVDGQIIRRAGPAR